jgi:hypothetical protein
MPYLMKGRASSAYGSRRGDQAMLRRFGRGSSLSSKRHHPAMSEGPTTADQVLQAHALKNEPKRSQEAAANDD